MRVLITGMGGELGTRVAMLLEGERRIDDIAGIDADPPRRRLRRSEFRRIDPRDGHRTEAAVRAFRPTALIHLGVYEPDARSAPRSAAARTANGTSTALRAAAESHLEAVVVRSGIEVYGRRRGSALVPDESVHPAPTSAFGRTLLDVERATAAVAHSRDPVATAVLRFAPVVGPHVPSPLGRYLRLPVVGFSAVADPTFSLLHQEDAARAVVHALLCRANGTWNVVGGGATTAAQAARLGGRAPVPVAGGAWAVTRLAASLAGAPIPDHVLELLRRGRTANGGKIEDDLGYRPERSTAEVVRELYDWAPVTHLHAARGDAA